MQNYTPTLVRLRHIHCVPSWQKAISPCSSKSTSSQDQTPRLPHGSKRTLLQIKGVGTQPYAFQTSNHTPGTACYSTSPCGKSCTSSCGTRAGAEPAPGRRFAGLCSAAAAALGVVGGVGPLQGRPVHEPWESQAHPHQPAPFLLLGACLLSSLRSPVRLPLPFPPLGFHAPNCPGGVPPFDR